MFSKFHDTYAIGQDEKGRTMIISVSNKKSDKADDGQANTTTAQRLKLIKEKYSNEDIQDLELRKAHFDHTRINEWESDETHFQIDPLETLSDKEKVELALEGGGDFPPEYYQKKPVKKGLGFEDYLHGLEFRDPKERYEIHKHLHEKGSDSKDAQIIKLSRFSD